MVAPLGFRLHVHIADSPGSSTNAEFVKASLNEVFSVRLGLGFGLGLIGSVFGGHEESQP